MISNITDTLWSYIPTSWSYTPDLDFCLEALKDFEPKPGLLNLCLEIHKDSGPRLLNSCLKWSLKEPDPTEDLNICLKTLKRWGPTTDLLNLVLKDFGPGIAAVVATSEIVFRILKRNNHLPTEETATNIGMTALASAAAMSLAGLSLGMSEAISPAQVHAIFKCGLCAAALGSHYFWRYAIR